jgi:hypothetical protein
MNDRPPLAGRGAQLLLFQEEVALPVPDWRGRTPPEMRADAPEGYSLDLSGDEPRYVLADGNSEPAHELDDDFELLDDAAGVPDEDDGDDTDGWSAPREWAPYCADTIAMKGTVRKPTNRLGALWICTGGGGRATDRTMSVYRVVPLADYRSPHPDLPLSYQEHNALSSDHPYRYGYEGMLVSWQKKPHVLTDEHVVFGHPYVPHPEGRGYIPDPDWHPHDDDAVRSDRNPWRDDSDAWQPNRRLI